MRIEITHFFHPLVNFCSNNRNNVFYFEPNNYNVSLKIKLVVEGISPGLLTGFAMRKNELLVLKYYSCRTAVLTQKTLEFIKLVKFITIM